jgi:glucan-binding YG repeat protein
LEEVSKMAIHDDMLDTIRYILAVDQVTLEALRKQFFPNNDLKDAAVNNQDDIKFIDITPKPKNQNNEESSDEEDHYCDAYEKMKVFYPEQVDHFIEAVSILGEEIQKLEDTYKYPVTSPNNRASRRSKGKMQEASKWRRSNVNRRFYE